MARQPRPVNVESWLDEGGHLPKVLRDFHLQKDVFKAMHEIVEERPGALIKRPSWIEGHCYIIEVFLRFMARRGYTLQRTRRHGNFRDLETDVAYQNRLRTEAFSAMVASSAKREEGAR